MCSGALFGVIFLTTCFWVTFRECLHETVCDFSTMCFLVSVEGYSMSTFSSLSGVSWTNSSAVTTCTLILMSCMLVDPSLFHWDDDYVVFMKCKAV